MTELILWISCLILLGLFFFNPTVIKEFSNHYFLSYNSIILVIILLITCIIHLFIHLVYSRKLGINFIQSILLPSTLVPTITIFLYCVPIFWSIFDKKYSIPLINKHYINSAVMLIVTASLLLMIGLTIGKYRMVLKLNNKIKQNIFFKRKLDFIILMFKYKNIFVFSLIVISVIIAPFAIGLRTDLIVEGGRGFSVNSNLLQVIIPLVGILSTILTVLAGIYYSYLRKPVIFIIPLMDLLPRAITLSRGFFLPLILFVCSSSLLGKTFPSWVYFALIPCSFLLGAVALVARGLSSGGVSGFASGFDQILVDTSDSIRVVFEANSNLGIVSNAVAFHNPSQNFIDGLLTWLKTILPIPSFLGTKDSIPDVATLLGITNLGIPMPAVGELYFQMGWLGLSVYFALGWWLGRLEANIIFHTKVYGRAYWPHVLIWMSLLYGYIFSFHSASRGSSRVLFYAVSLVWLLEIVISFSKKQSNTSNSIS